MAFDPTKPVEDSPLDAAEMRSQLNALKALIDTQAAQIATLTAQQAAVLDLIRPTPRTMWTAWRPSR